MEAQQTQLVQQGIKKEGFHITVTQMCITAVFMALTCVATMVVQIPIPLGYAHLGDSVILICAFFFGPVVGALAGGIGSAMADINWICSMGSSNTYNKDNHANNSMCNIWQYEK